MADNPHVQMADYYLTEARGHMDPTGLATAAVAESNLAVAHELKTANLIAAAVAGTNFDMIHQWNTHLSEAFTRLGIERPQRD